MVHRREQEVFELQIGVGESESVEKRQGLEELGVKNIGQSYIAQNRSNICHGEGVIVVLFQNVVKRLAQQVHHHAVMSVELELVLSIDVIGPQEARTSDSSGSGDPGLAR